MRADAIAPPRLNGDALGSARFKSRPGDFRVEEVLGFEPSGEGEHCFLWVEKTGRTSNEVATQFADRLSIRRRLVSHCGLKDKQAVTCQWFSLHLPGIESPGAAALEGDGVRVLRVTRNTRKLRRGTHRGNRFQIRLRDCRFSRDQAEARWAKIISAGVPNYFGPQRFGHGGGNIRQARAMLSGASEVGDRMLRGLLISAARSLIFNAVVARRVLAGSWNQPLTGDVFGFADNRSLVLPEKLRGDELQRVAAGELELTAPLWGQGELPSRDAVRSIEADVAAQHADLASGLERLNLRQERRVIRLIPRRPVLDWQGDADLVLNFELPKGTYATTVLRELAEITVEFPPGGE